MLYIGAQKINKRLKPEPREGVFLLTRLLVCLRQHTCPRSSILAKEEAPLAEVTSEMDPLPQDPENPTGVAGVAGEPAAPDDPAAVSKAHDAGLKKRMQIFIEAIVKMVSTVFLAACVSLAKVDMKDKPLVRHFLSGLVGGTLVVAILLLVFITLPNRFPDRLYRWSLTFLHGSGVLLMVVAYLILRLISKDYHNWPCWILLPIFGIVTVIWWIMTLLKGHERGDFVYLVNQEEHLDKLENFVDFSAAITFLLFLGLGVLLLGGQYSTMQLLYYIIYLSFFSCMAALCSMLACIVLVPPVSNHICMTLRIFNNIFGVALALIVLLITLGKLGSCWFVPTLALILSALPFGIWAVLDSHYGAIERGDEQVTPACLISRFFKKCVVCLCEAIGNRGDDPAKPASLDLTKVTFTGFMAISAYTISQKSPVSFGDSSCWFIFLTAIAVNNALCWRLITHHKEPSPAWFAAGYFASLAAHAYSIFAAIPFALMASKAFTKIASAPSPAPSPS